MSFRARLPADKPTLIAPSKSGGIIPFDDKTRWEPSVYRITHGLPRNKCLCYADLGTWTTLSRIVTHNVISLDGVENFIWKSLVGPLPCYARGIQLNRTELMSLDFTHNPPTSNLWNCTSRVLLNGSNTYFFPGVITMQEHLADCQSGLCADERSFGFKLPLFIRHPS